MKSKFIILIYIIQLGIISSFSQKEANFWFFGANSGLDFSNNNVTPITGSLNTLEGCASISDRNGQLLFYTDGTSVWDRNHNLMPNGTGLLGFFSSTQSALIIRKPGSETIYYIFTADGNSFSMNHHMTNGYRYSIVDMSLNGGFGDVTSDKNVLIYAPSTEKISAVKHADGVGVWIMTHEFNTSRFRSYLLTCNGIDISNPVISNVGEVHCIISGTIYNYYEAIGQMKFSPDGKRLALAILGKLRVEVFDFDASTGVLSNPIDILAYWPDGFLNPGFDAWSLENVYGVEFSPNSQFLYLSSIDYSNMYQYNLSYDNSWDISWNGVQFYGFNMPWSGSTGLHGGLQLAPNGKIYGGINGYFGLNVIDQPNNLGLQCNLIESPILINDGKYGLPSFCASYFNPDAIKILSDTCNKTITVTSNFNQASSYMWDFGDINSQTDISYEPTGQYSYSTFGEYLITLVVTNSIGCSDTIKKNHFNH